MSSEYFGLIMDPFESGPDPRFLYMDAARRNVFAQLLSAVYECKGVVLLACRRGLGKSTLVRHLSDQLAALDSVLLLYPGGVLSCRPGMSFADILASCRGRLDRRNKSANDEDRLPATLEQAAGRGQAVTLILDDADALDDGALSRLRGLCEPDDDDRRSMSVVLVGSAELPRRLERLSGRDNRPGPVDLLLELPPLRDRDIDRMVRHRLIAAGHADGSLFSPVALAEIARRSRGEPMRIVALCAAALALAEQGGKATVSRELVERAAERVGDVDDRDLAPSVVAPTSSRTRLDDVDVQDEPRPLRPAADAVMRGPVRRLDDVAEAIRAADRRSTSGGADPHIRFAPAPSRPLPEREPHPAAEEHTLAAQPRGLGDQTYALYPGFRPSEARPSRRRRGLGALLAVGLVLALLAAGGTYAMRAGMVDLGGVAGGVRALVDKVVHTIGSLTRSDPDADETVAGISAGAAGDEDPSATDLGFSRFGPSGGRDVKAVEPYDFAPPPPQAGESNPGDAGAAGPQAGPSGGSPGTAAGPVAPPAPPPASPAPSAAQNEGPPPTPAASQPDAGAAAMANATTTIGPLSSLRPPETAKPAPPQPPASATTASRLAPRAEEPQARPGREDAGRPQNEPLLARGDEYLGTGDLDMARTFYQMAFERGSAEAAIRMGWTFDPQYFQRMGLRGEASPREAILWYQEALRRGSPQASGRLSELATWLQSAAASGDLEAQRILRMWQG